MTRPTILKGGIPLLFLVVFSSSQFYCQYNPYPDGKRLYQQYCADCHGAKGKGFQQLIPPVAQTPFMTDSLQRVVCIIKNGESGPFAIKGRTYNYPMPGFPELNHNQIANIVNYINYRWNGTSFTLASDEAQALVRQCP